MDDSQNQITLGAFEEVVFPDLSTEKHKAKIDTGAYSGVVHCQKIQKRNGSLYFTPLDGKKMIKTNDFVVRYITSSNGIQQKRFLITTKIVIRGCTYPIVISLSNRASMKWPILIGRKFLKQNNFLVDVNASNTNLSAEVI